MSGSHVVADHASTRMDACVATLLCDRHDPSATAFAVVDSAGAVHEYTFGELRERSSRLASGLAGLGVRQGDRVASLMSKNIELVLTQLAAWRLGAVYVPLFTAFGPQAIGDRLRRADVKVVVCDEHERPKLSPSPELGQHTTWTLVNTSKSAPAEDVSFDELLKHPGQPNPVTIGPDGDMMLLFTSGTTGKPKMVSVPTRALASFESYFLLGLGVTSDDVYWNIADPGWAYGLYYSIVAPLTVGHRSLLATAKFAVDDTWRILSQLGVTNFAAAPTVFRALRASNPSRDAMPELRRISSAGEPLNTELIGWSTRHLGAPVHDHYGQTELGMILGNQHHPDVAREIRPGSMGVPLPGWELVVLAPDRDEPLGPDQIGRLAVDTTASPSMWFGGYLDDPAATAERFSRDGRWYITGDVARYDPDGFFYFSARDDDVIVMAGYRIGPFDVESVLIGHPAVAEAACVAVTDDLRGEVIKAYVVLSNGWEGTPELSRELQDLVKQKYAAHAYPRHVEFTHELPKTPSGKIQRALLRQRRTES